MSKPKNMSSLFKGLRRPVARLSLVLLLVAVLVVGSVPKLVHAVSCSTVSSCQAQINSLDNQSTQDQQAVSTLASQAQGYQATIDALNAQIAGLEQQISVNEAKQASLEQQITNTEQEIAQKKSTLSDDIQTMYVNGQMSTIEELATSQNLSDFVDKQQYRSVVQDQLTYMIQQITSLQQTLQTQKTQVDGLVSTEQAQNNQLSYSQSQVQQLLNYDQSQQAAYNAQISSASSSISQLQAQLTALNSAGTTSEISGGTCGGGYPTQTPSTTSPGTDWGCDEPQDSTTDNWDMDNRECVSYTAFMAAKLYGVSTMNWGNAYQWIGAAEAAGYTVDQTPAVGAIAIRNRDYSVAGDVGHAMYVEAVDGPDSITVEEYNENYNGTFDTRTFAPSSYDSRGGLYYIHL